MGQELLFTDDQFAAPPPPVSFVFEGFDADALFSASTMLELEAMIDRRLWVDGYSGTEEGRAALIANIKARILERFVKDSEFAAEISTSGKTKEVTVREIRRVRAMIEKPAVPGPASS